MYKNNYNCAICNCDLESRTPKGQIIYRRDSNQNHEIESDCDCWFCVQCLEWMHCEGVSHCRRCNGDIEQLVSESCPDRD